MENLIAKYSADRAVAEYKTMSRDTAKYYTDWIQMYYLGEKLLSLKRYEDARIIAENNEAAFPERDFMALSLANIYLALNRKQEAIKYYEKTLQLNTESEEAKNRLNELKGK